MQALAIALGAVAAALLLAVIALLFERARLAHRAAVARELRDRLDDTDAQRLAVEAKLTDLTGEASALTARNEELTHAHDTHVAELRSHYEEKLEAAHQSFDEIRRTEREQIEEFKTKLYEMFSASAGKATREALDLFQKTAIESFDKSREKTASELKLHVAPIAETLKKTDAKLGEIEKLRLGAYEKLTEQVRAIAENNRELRDQTGNLVDALRKPQVRGRYGEIQLQRVAELAGMTAYCDFATQTSVRDSEGNLLRPDMIARLPNGRAIAIDAKTNIEAYLDAIESDSEDQQEHHLDRFARHVADQAAALSKKSYWADAADSRFDFVVMFIPGDQFIDAALERRPDLLDLTAQQGVILASPSTLIGLLRAVHVGWREKMLSDSAEELFELGKELHERAAVALGYASKLGESIEQAQKRYNEFVGSVDNRLMPTLRKFEEKGAKSAKELEEPRPLEITTREIRTLTPAPSSERSESRTGAVR